MARAGSMITPSQGIQTLLVSFTLTGSLGDPTGPEIVLEKSRRG